MPPQAQTPPIWILPSSRTPAAAPKSTAKPCNTAPLKNPVEADYQTINIYIPEAYFHGGSINDYTADTAPIFLPNKISG